VPAVRGLKLRKKLLHWFKKEHGNFTLESTFVFPMLMMIILIFILFGMYMYQKVVLYYAASATAERAAFSWDNSYRDPRHGMLSETKYDGLYWRVGEDEMLTSLFGMAGDAADATVALPLEMREGEGSSELTGRKMEQSARWMEHAGLMYEGKISYSRGALKRMIEVKLRQPLSIRPFEQGWLKREPKTAASASVVDPMEFIRSVDLVRYYSTKLANNGGGAAQSHSQAGKILTPYKGAGEAMAQ
jgi:hypothetical protein